MGTSLDWLSEIYPKGTQKEPSRRGRTSQWPGSRTEPRNLDSVSEDMTRWRVLRLVGLGAIAATPLLASPMPSSTDAGLRRTVETVLSAARRKLMRHECRRVFLEFRDLSGETLLRKLQWLGETPQGQLMLRIELRDGGGLGLCNRPRVLAMSQPGQALVQLLWRSLSGGRTEKRGLRGQHPHPRTAAYPRARREPAHQRGNHATHRAAMRLVT